MIWKIWGAAGAKNTRFLSENVISKGKMVLMRRMREKYSMLDVFKDKTLIFWQKSDSENSYTTFSHLHYTPP